MTSAQAAPVSTPADIFISVAEPSADMHGALLVEAAQRRFPQARWYGLTGPRLRAAGVETVFDFTQHAAMLTGVLRVIGRARAALRAAEQAWRRRPPTLLVVMDSAALHLRMAQRARRLGIPVLYYIAPQTWASRRYRNRTLARVVDHLACILPFEEPFFRAAGIPATYVGHPLFETLQRERAASGEAMGSGDAPLIALLPGSRDGVVRRVLPLQLQVLQRLRQRMPTLRAAISTPDGRRAQIEAILAAQPRAGSAALSTTDAAAPQLTDDNAALLSAASLAVVASGTATLHVAAYRTPMVVMYDAGRLLNTLHGAVGRWILHTPYLALVNILAQERIVPEFVPCVPDIDEAASVAAALLTDPAQRAAMTQRLDALVRPLEQTRASEAVCDLLTRWLD